MKKAISFSRLALDREIAQTEPSLPSRIVVMGASAGALDAVSAILTMLPQGFALPVLVVVHLPPDKKSILAELIQSKCQIGVREAEDKETIQPGTAYLAPPDYHLLVEADNRLSLSSEEPVHYSRPAIDVLFETAADAFGPKVIGIILTGSSSDGTSGLKAVMNAGGVGLVQIPEQALAAVMPRSALEACPNALALSLAEIAAYLLNAVQQA